MKKGKTLGLFAGLMTVVYAVGGLFGLKRKTTITGESPKIRTHKGHGQSTARVVYANRRSRALPGQLRRAGAYFIARGYAGRERSNGHERAPVRDD